jgi:hypothetical protein
VAGGLPVNLLDETGRMLQRVVHAHLPPERWSDIATTLNRVDHAVQAGEESALQQELVQLRWVVGELKPSPGPGAPTPQVYAAPPLAASPPQEGGRKPALWMFLLVGAFCVALPALLLPAYLVLGTTDTTSAPETETSPDTPPTGDSDTSSLWIAGALGALAVAVVAVAIVINVLRRRRRVPPAPESTFAPRPPVEPPRLMPAPAQVREQANRTIMSLAAHGGRP